MDLQIDAARAVVDGQIRPVSLGIRDGHIVAVENLGTRLGAADTVGFGSEVVLMPGLVDTHVHVNEPGHADWEGFESATRAAAAGGVTTLVDMPLDSVPVTTDVRALAAKRAAAKAQVHIDVGFWGGVIPGNIRDLRPLHDAGVLGFKCFLADSGTPEFPPVDPATLTAALRELADLDAPLLVHAESAAELATAPPPSGRSYQGFLASRPAQAEQIAIEQVVAAARATGARVHIVHVSSAESLPVLARARADGVGVTAETCPHYLALQAESVPDGATEYACCPPIRGRANAEGLWDGLRAGVLDMVVSDHSPSPPELKHREAGDFARAWGGISSLQLGLAVMWTQARRRGVGLVEVARWMAGKPAELAGLRDRGRIAVGARADLCAFDPQAEFIVEPARLHHRHPLTPYARARLSGVVTQTWLAGARIDPTSAPTGHLVCGR